MFTLLTGDMASPEPTGPTSVRNYEDDDAVSALRDLCDALAVRNAAQLEYVPGRALAEGGLE